MCKVKGCVAGPGLEKQIVATKKAWMLKLYSKNVCSLSAVLSLSTQGSCRNRKYLVTFGFMSCFTCLFYPTKCK